MPLSILSFRKIISLAYLALALAGGALITLAFSHQAQARFFLVKPYDFASELEARRPDLILVGNSWVFSNIDKALLETELSVRLGRPIRALFATEGGSTAAWSYLVLKNQIAASGAAGIPVGIFTTGTSLTNLDWDFNARQLWSLGKLLSNDEEAFLAKLDRRHRRPLVLLRHMPDRWLICKYLLRRWANIWLNWLPGPPDAQALLESRFRLSPTRSFDLLKAITDEPEPRDQRACLHLAECVDKTFLPDMIQTMKRFRLFVVEIRQRPGTLDPQAMSAYRRDLSRYLSDNGVVYISLRSRRELGDTGLFHDENHLNQRGRAINTRLVADEIIRQKLFSNSY